MNNLNRELNELLIKIKLWRESNAEDFNPLTAVLPAHDEVRLHSGFLFSLLDPNGSHYQGSYFLREFLSMFDDFMSFQFDNAKVIKEHMNIDLYITDGIQHIILENKVYAKDQKAQIARYINTICEKNEKITSENLYLIYLSIDRDKPSEYSLDGLELHEDKLRKGDESVAKYIALHYMEQQKDNRSIVAWLRKCGNEKCYIPNLRYAIEAYRKVIYQLYNVKENELLDFRANFFQKDYDHYKFALEYKEETNNPEGNLFVEAAKDFRKEINTTFACCYFDKLDNFFKENDLIFIDFDVVDKNKQRFLLSWQELAEVWIVLNEDFSLSSVGVGGAWKSSGYQGNQAIRKRVEDFKSKIQMDQTLAPYIIGKEKGASLKNGVSVKMRTGCIDKKYKIDEYVYHFYNQKNNCVDFPNEDDFKELKLKLEIILNKISELKRTQNQLQKIKEK